MMIIYSKKVNPTKKIKLLLHKNIFQLKK
jgi:hypothetical protein